MADEAEKKTGAELRADDPELRREAARAMGSVRSEAKTEAGRESLDKLRKQGIMGGRQKGSKLSEEHKLKISEGRRRAAEAKAAAAAAKGEPS